MRKLSLFSDETRRKMSEAAKRRCTSEWRNKKSESQSVKVDINQVKEMYESGMTQTEIAAVLGTTQKVIWKRMKDHGIKARVAAKRNQKGSNNHMWTGGRVSNEAGYILVRFPNHPRAKANNGYVFEHILVAEEKIGRHLVFYKMGDPCNEVVHHINQKKNDNRPENLQVMTHEEHMRLHGWLSKNGGGASA
ncbi:HNH endonuclease signature motif containing protein [Paenibacillus sp. FSL P2-0173]|uniref:HNH endonuclease signature motif containing protein n=1 Tax=Paenibacillus sp. FSL P2-0173 TaxID=2921627 RepID=UPI0030F7DCB2